MAFVLLELNAMKLTLLFAFAFPLLADDAPKPNIEQLQAQIAHDRAELEKLQKLLVAWQNRAISCIGQQVNDKALAPQPQQNPEPAKKQP